MEAQATDRAYRIGQTKRVSVHRLVCAGTLEERVAELVARKAELSDLSVAAGESWLGDLAPDELRELLALRPGAGDAGDDDDEEEGLRV